MDKDKSKTYKSLRNAARVVGGISEMLCGIALANPVTGVIAAPLMYDGATRYVNGVQGASKNNSMMITSENKIYNKLFNKPEHQITQNIPNLTELIRVAFVKDKEKMLITQELNFLLGAKRLDDNGEKIKYNTKSQSITRFMLSRAQKSGFIENFESVQSGESLLIAEKIMTGNLKGIRRKKTKIFDMSFNLSDKEITDADIIKFLKVDTLDSKKFDIVRDKEGKITSINLNTMNAIKESLSKAKEKYLPTAEKKC